MEVCAVAAPGVASPLGVATSPSRARLVVAHRAEDILVERARLFHGAGLALNLLRRDARQPAGDRHQLVRAQILTRLFRRYPQQPGSAPRPDVGVRGVEQPVLPAFARQRAALSTYAVVLHVKAVLGSFCLGGDRIEDG